MASTAAAAAAAAATPAAVVTIEQPDQQNEALYIVTFNRTDAIVTTVTSFGAHVKAWIEETLNLNRDRLFNLVVGFDVEWRPSFSRVQNPVAVLQFCVGRRCLVFLIRHADWIPDALPAFMLDDRFKFVGVGVHGDVERVVEDHGLNVRKAVDLRVLAAQKTGRIELKRTGLAGLAKEVMGIKVDKPKRVTMSRWDNIYLSFDQIKYACIDAFLSFEIGRRLYAGEF